MQLPHQELFLLYQSGSFYKGKATAITEGSRIYKKIANVRIYVKRIIEFLKNRYFILLSRLPITLIKRKGDTDVATLVFVCAALTNFGEPVVQCLQLSTF